MSHSSHIVPRADVPRGFWDVGQVKGVRLYRWLLCFASFRGFILGPPLKLCFEGVFCV